MTNTTQTQARASTELWDAIEKFLGWLERSGYAGYDPYDFWATPFGIKARSIYYENRLIGMPLAAPLLALDMILPQARVFFVQKKRHPSADAQIALGFLSLADAGSQAGTVSPLGKYGSLGVTESGSTSENMSRFNPGTPALQHPDTYIRKAIALAEDLLESSIPGYSGLCWGYPFDWQNNRGLWKQGTPFITSTPYIYEVFTGLFDRTGEIKYAETAASIARFASRDLRETKISDSASACSYSPFDDSCVVNASSYRAFLLFDAFIRFRTEEYFEQAKRNLNFVLEAQRPDGSWLYAEGNAQDAFIDHFHTCFVLKNLAKIYGLMPEERIRRAIFRGYDYYRKNLFDEKGRPKVYAVRPRLQVVREEMYDYAESINLGVLLADMIPEALRLSRRLAGRVRKHFQNRDGSFATRVYIGGIKQSMPYIRWPQAPMFHAFAGLYKKSEKI